MGGIGTALVSIIGGVISGVSGTSKAEAEAEAQAYLDYHKNLISSNTLPVIMIGGMVMVALFASAAKSKTPKIEERDEL